MRKLLTVVILECLGVCLYHGSAAAGCASYIRLEEPGFVVQDVSEQVGSLPLVGASVSDNQGNKYLTVIETMQIGQYTADKAVVRKLGPTGIYTRFITLDPTQPDQDWRSFYNIEFDTVNGLMYLHVYKSSRCEGTVKISGFAPLFEILQTYTPGQTRLGFRVPAIPEGLHTADHFDSYWGHVSDLPDFTQAQPMQCHYPSAPPSVGDYLTVADTSPPPPPGQANYIVTAVSDGAQRRYGRQRIGGTLSGRDPALLPSCP